MEITYTKNGDYFIPDIVIKKQSPIGHFGRLHKISIVRTVQQADPVQKALRSLRRDQRSRKEPAERHHLQTHGVVRIEREAESGESNALGRQDEYMPVSRRENCQDGICLW